MSPRDPRALLTRLPGRIGTGLLVVATSFWTFWSFGELYYEAWGLPWSERIRYLLPAAACFLLLAIALSLPRLGGWLLVGIGGAFTAWWVNFSMSRTGGSLLGTVLALLPMSGLIVVAGILFLFEGRRRVRVLEMDGRDAGGFLRRHAESLVALAVPVAIAVGITAVRLPPVLGRLDDGERGGRAIEGNGVRLVWAPAGPGWNWRQPWGGYPPWDSLALYGVAPVGLDGWLEKRPGGHATEADLRETGLCRYLTADGLALSETPQDVWRLPTADELVRSLVRDGVHAGCTWSGEVGARAPCRTEPDKETPLWAPDQYPIYMWAADESGALEALYVSYNGWVHAQPKHWGNPRHGYRCVREP